jgi:hypothetical protein
LYEAIFELIEERDAVDFQLMAESERGAVTTMEDFKARKGLLQKAKQLTKEEWAHLAFLHSQTEALEHLYR